MLAAAKYIAIAQQSALPSKKARYIHLLASIVLLYGESLYNSHACRPDQCVDVWWWSEDVVSDHWKEKAAVKIHIRYEFSNLGRFHSPSLPEPFTLSLECAAFAVDAVVGFLNINCNTVLGVSSSYCLSVLTQSDFQCSLGFSHVHLQAILTEKESHTPLHCFCSGVLFFTCISSFRVFIGLKTGFTPRGAQTYSIFSLTPSM